MRHQYFRLYAVIFALTFPFFVSATTLADTLPAPRLILRASLSELFGLPYSKAQFGMDFRIAPRHYVELDGGPLLKFSLSRHQTNWETFSGFSLGASYRYYVAPAGLAAQRGIFWMSAGPRYQQLSGTISGDFTRQDQSYYQRLYYEVDEKRLGGHASIGFLFLAGKRFVIEPGMSLFFFDRQLAFSELPEDAIFYKNGSEYWHYERGAQAHDFGGSFALLLRIGWAFY